MKFVTVFSRGGDGGWYGHDQSQIKVVMGIDSSGVEKTRPYSVANSFVGVVVRWRKLLHSNFSARRSIPQVSNNLRAVIFAAAYC